jgi:hypothetical protein
MSSPRSKFIETITLQKLAGYAWDAMSLASTHDPELVKEIKQLRKNQEELLKALHKGLKNLDDEFSSELIHHHNHLVDVIDRRLEEKLRYTKK